ncbi:AMP-binding protein [Schlegelella aquatica]|uniref:AMP-binding protein n=1 Tax=Caldimonas aquatica TaxID=376175 RepID=UPI0037520A2D
MAFAPDRPSARVHDHLGWPFFEDRHRKLARELDAWAAQHVPADHPHGVDAACRALVRSLGDAGWLIHVVGGQAYGGAVEVIDTRAICLIRETLARYSGLADFAFAMQGLGSGAITLAGTDAQKARWLPRVARGEAIAAFALSEPDAGSDVAALACQAREEGDHVVLDGEKTWISNGGIADVYVVFARSEPAEAKGSKGISAYVVEAGTPGFEIAERIDVIAPHPLARLRFRNCRIPAAQRLGERGEGFKIAMRTLDVFRTSVAAAALGFARRALEEELVQIIDKAEISHALADRTLADELQAAAAQCKTLREVRYFNDPSPEGLEAAMERHPAAFDNVDTAATDTCMLAFTSGTTGTPKATMHFHRDVMAVCACWPRHVLKASPDDVFIGSPPLAFTFGLGGLLLFPMSIGASTVLLEKATPPNLVQAIPEFRATVLFTAPASYRAMAAQAAELRIGAPHGGSLRKCVSAGEAVPAATRQLWKQATGIEMIDGIGSTEMLHIFISADEAHARPGATGTVVPGYRACVMDEEGRPVPPGTVGRLAVKGPTGCRYLADERQRQYVKDGWNYTGDAYYMDEDGYFHYQSRTDDLIVSAGYNIGAPEVEDALLQHPAVAECGVIGVPDEERGQIVKAFVVLRAGHEPSDALVRELQDFVKQTIAPCKYPRAIEFRASLPRTETGKLQRFKLRQEQQARA